MIDLGVIVRPTTNRSLIKQKELEGSNALSLGINGNQQCRGQVHNGNVQYSSWWHQTWWSDTHPWHDKSDNNPHALAHTVVVTNNLAPHSVSNNEVVDEQPNARPLSQKDEAPVTPQWERRASIRSKQRVHLNGQCPQHCSAPWSVTCCNVKIVSCEHVPRLGTIYRHKLTQPSKGRYNSRPTTRTLPSSFPTWCNSGQLRSVRAPGHVFWFFKQH